MGKSTVGRHPRRNKDGTVSMVAQHSRAVPAGGQAGGGGEPDVDAAAAAAANPASPPTGSPSAAERILGMERDRAEVLYLLRRAGSPEVAAEFEHVRAGDSLDWGQARTLVEAALREPKKPTAPRLSGREFTPDDDPDLLNEGDVVAYPNGHRKVVASNELFIGRRGHRKVVFDDDSVRVYRVRKPGGR